MSKRRSINQSNTLLNYFQSPNLNTSKKSADSKTPYKDNKNKHKSIDDSDDDIKIPKKRNRILIADSDSESENECNNRSTPKRTDGRMDIKKQKINADRNEIDNESKPAKLPKKALGDLYGFQKLHEINNTEAFGTIVHKASVSGDTQSTWLHDRLEFLQPNKIRDANRRRPDHPEYDSRTLYVPETELNGLTPAMRQWWILKSQHMDSVLFFKVGKFYELYHMDAVVGVRQLGLTYMKGEFAHSGFPETAYAKMAGALVDKGYKVARIEQTETPEMMMERCKLQNKSSKYDKVVKREICQISTKASCVYNAQMPEGVSQMACFMYAVVMKRTKENNIRFGVCFIETSIATIYLAEFDDDKHLSKLLALFAEHPPGLILTERGATDPYFNEVLSISFLDVLKDTLASKTQFYDPSTVLETLSSECYFLNKNNSFEWPEFFKQVADDCVPKAAYELALKALGGCMWYLKDSKIDIQVFSMGKFELYHPLDLTASKQTQILRDYLVLDSVTISNLNLLGTKGTLQSTLDNCVTAFGKRLLLQWICRPLCNVDKIRERQKAVNELWNNPDMLKCTRDVLKNLPDLERQVVKIHSYGNKFYATQHPDGRAVLYETKTYSKRKILDLLKTLQGFEIAQEIPSIFKGCESHLLQKITHYAPAGLNLDLSKTLNFFKEAFDQNEAEKEGKIIPKQGIDKDYDAAEKAIAKIKKKLDDYLAEQCEHFGCKVYYFGSDRKRFQLDVPDNNTHKVTAEYQLEGSKKGSKRYSTPTTKELLAEMMQAERERAKVVSDLNRRIFQKFSERGEEWEQVTYCLTILDVLCSLAEYARTYSQDVCIPLLNTFSEKPHIVIRNGRHPCIMNVDKFVPNDTCIAVDNSAGHLILTGPNMGGKSTLMRQVAIITVMAQMGCCTPASKCEIDLVDRIFTRIGAHDDIVQGQSTFFVELSEASSILEHASAHSLVLIDELGRGTSTHDGNAIATAYVSKLIAIKCRTIFSTHYHSLVDKFIDREEVQLGHMACMIGDEDDPTNESVTLLYKFARGRCPKSYGFNAAGLAGLKPSVITKGRALAEELENMNRNSNLFRKIFTSSSVQNIQKSLSALII